MKRSFVAYPLFTKATRILLAFCLVFFGSLHLERVAFGIGDTDIYSGNPSGGYLSEITIYEVAAVDGKNVYTTVASTTSTAEGKTSYTPTIGERQGSRSFRAVASWVDAEGKTITTEDGKTLLTDASSLLEWQISGDIATIDKNTGMVTAAGTADGKTGVVARLKASANSLVSSSFVERFPGKAFAVVYDITISNQAEADPESLDPDPEPEPTPDPYITSIEILQSDGQNFTDERTLDLDAATQDSYGFQVRVAIKDPGVAAGEEVGTVVVCTPSQGLEAALAAAGARFASGFQFSDSDIVWSVEGSDTAQITQQGVLSITGKAGFSVHCTTTKGKEAEQPPADTITVNADKTEPAQPYVSSLSIFKTDGSPFTEGETLDLTETPSSSASGGQGEQPEGEPSTGEGGSNGTAEQGDSTTPTAESAPTSYQFQLQVEMLDPADDSTTTYIHTAEGWTRDGEAIDSASLPFAVTWEASSASISQDGLLSIQGDVQSVVRCLTTNGKDNALVEDSVTVNHTATDKPDDPSTEPSVEIEYAAANKDEEATLTAQPKDVEPDTWNIAWEESTDEGETWEATGQTEGSISVLTDDAHIGRQYRVRMEVEGFDKAFYSNVVTIAEAEDSGGEPDGPYVRISYTPVPKGELAYFISSPENTGPISYYNTWEESTDGGASWHEIPPYESQTLTVTTDDEHIGRMYRARVDVLQPDEQTIDYTMYSEAKTLIEGSAQFSVFIDVPYPFMGEPATFITDVRYIPDGTREQLTYVWEVSTDGGGESGTWTVLKDADGKDAVGYLPTYTIITSSEILSNHYRVRVRTPKGAETISTDQMLAVQEEQSGNGGNDNPPEHFEPVLPSDDTPNNQTPAPGPTEPSDSPQPEDSDGQNTTPSQQPNPTEPTQQTPQDQQQQPETMSQMVDRYGEVQMAYDDGSTATMKPLDQVETETDPEVNDAIENGIEITPGMESTPGVRLHELYMQQAQPTIHEILQNNTLARLILPFILAFVAAGATEKYVRYRNQRRPSLAAF